MSFQHAAFLLALSCLLFRLGVFAGLDLSYGDDADLHHFVTRPELKAPILSTDVKHGGNISPGYIFVAPYVNLAQEDRASNYYEACQTGPLIYDATGALVWSGACQVYNMNVADFRSSVAIDGTFELSFIDIQVNASDKSPYGSGRSKGQGVILNEGYEQRAVVKVPNAIDSFNMHEFRLVDRGRAALQILWKPEYVDVSDLRLDPLRDAGWVGNMGIREVDVASGATNFEWWGLDHIPLTKSSWPLGGIEGPFPSTWDYLHINSIDKNIFGDYLVSARHTNAIYKVSSISGQIIWTLSDSSADFNLKQLNFTRQHDARFVDPEILGLARSEGREYISLFNNHGDEYQDEPEISSVLILELHHSRKEVRQLRRVTRPDNGQSIYGGNSHMLENGNTLNSWGENAYMSEHTSDGAVVFQAQFESTRFQNYRAYKLDWKAKPSEDELRLACFAHGTSPQRATTICYMSWNGATEVREWRLHSGNSSDSVPVGNYRKEGFETKVQINGVVTDLILEGLSEDGTSLGKSQLISTIMPSYW